MWWMCPPQRTIMWVVQDAASFRYSGRALVKSLLVSRGEDHAHGNEGEHEVRIRCRRTGRKRQGLVQNSSRAAASALPFRFVVYGDNRTRDDVHRRVVEMLIKTASRTFCCRPAT